jgi:hypothetical protein
VPLGAGTDVHAAATRGCRLSLVGVAVIRSSRASQACLGRDAAGRDGVVQGLVVAFVLVRVGLRKRRPGRSSRSTSAVIVAWS